MKSSANIKGSATFTFETERFLLDGKMVAEPPNDEAEYQVITLTVSGWYYSYPAKTYGDPQDCYPADSDHEITSLVDANGKDWIDEVTPSEMDSIVSKLIEEVSSGDRSIDYEP